MKKEYNNLEKFFDVFLNKLIWYTGWDEKKEVPIKIRWTQRAPHIASGCFHDTNGISHRVHYSGDKNYWVDWEKYFKKELKR